jgi:hypothetical protein
MKSRISGVLAVCFILGLLPPAMNGQEPEKRYQMLLVIDEVVKPSMKAEYYEAGKKWIAFMKDHEFPYLVNTYWTGDNHVYWSMPIQNYAEIDTMMAASNKIFEEFPDDSKAVMDAFKGTYESSRMCVYTLDYKYSMFAEEEEEGEPEEENFIFFDIYYCEPGTETEINKLWDEWKAYLVDKEIVQSWGFYWGTMGTDNPMILMAATAKNRIAFYEENAKMWKILGEEASKVRRKMLKFVTKQEQKSGWFQKELSYTPVKKEE